MQPVCGLYIGGEILSLIALRPTKKGLSLEAGGTDYHNVCEGVDFGPAVRALCKAQKVAGGDAYVTLPKQQAILRNITLPSNDRAELGQMARFEAERHIPFHAERHSIGYHVMRSLGLEGSEVILGAADEPVVKRALSVADGGNLRLSGITLSSVALVNSVLYANREWLKGKTVAILSIGLDALDIILMTDERLIFARSVSLNLRGVLEAWAGFSSEGGAARPDMARLATAARMIDCTNLEGHYGTTGAAGGDKDKAEQVRGWIERLLQELRRTHDFARREMKCPPIDAVAITGEGALLRNLGQYLYVNLNVAIQTLNPVGELPGASAKKFPFDGLELVIPFGGAIGTLFKNAYQLDLTPGEHYRQTARQRTMRQLVVAGVILAITLGLAVGVWLRFQSIRELELAAYDRENMRLKPQVAELEDKKAKLAIIRKYMNDPNSAMAVLNSISGAPAVPGQVSLSNITYDKGDKVIINGDAKTLPDVNAFIQQLRNTPHFAQITQGDSTLYNPPGIQQQVYRFQLDCILNAEAVKSPRGGNGGAAR